MADRRLRPADLIAPAATLAAMIATPLLRPRGTGRRRAAAVVIGGLATTTATAAARRSGATRTGVGAALVAGLTASVEHLGTVTGFPFGAYGYSNALQPQLAGVPAIVPGAWFAMAVPARETAHRALGGRSTPATRIVAGAAALTAWDLFLDPQMVGEGYWNWTRRGRYRGIPASNFVGWFVTGLAVMAILESTMPVPAQPDGLGDALVGIYTGMAVMETVGFAAFFRDRIVALVGGSAMAAFVVPAVVRRSWRAS